MFYCPLGHSFIYPLFLHSFIHYLGTHGCLHDSAIMIKATVVIGEQASTVSLHSVPYGSVPQK